jgi:hypothetical protein
MKTRKILVSGLLALALILYLPLYAHDAQISSGLSFLDLLSLLCVLTAVLISTFIGE